MNKQRLLVSPKVRQGFKNHKTYVF